MPKTADADDVERLLTEGGQLVEVLPGEEYAWAHLPGAVNAPLKELGRRLDDLDRDRPVVLYCHDYLCDLSPRAASFLEYMGFADSYDYALSKMDWIGRGRDYEGSADLVQRHIERNVPTCDATAPAAALAEHVESAGICVVVNDAGVVFGAVDARALEQGTGDTAADVMRPGVSTVRAGEERAKLDERLAGKNLSRIVVTDPGGHLLGLYRRQ